MKVLVFLNIICHFDNLTFILLFKEISKFRKKSNIIITIDLYFTIMFIKIINIVIFSNKKILIKKLYIKSYKNKNKYIFLNKKS